MNLFTDYLLITVIIFIITFSFCLNAQPISLNSSSTEDEYFFPLSVWEVLFGLLT